MSECSVLGGLFALAMQGLLFFVTCMVLVTKKYKEASDRTWFEFGLDSSKQLVGAGWTHVANMLCAILFAGKLAGVDGCTWYAANIIVDTTVGVFVEYLLLVGVQVCFVAFGCQAAVRALDTGSYYEGAAFKWSRYVMQMIVWLSIVTVMKVSMVALMRVLPVIVFAIDDLLEVFEDRPQLKLFAVMICIPLVMNTFQFVITDNFIKKKKKRSNARSVSVQEAPLVDARL